jgi:hypothetical protein
MFFYHGSTVAGQMGMTWTIVTALQAASLAWVQTRVPRFGMLIKEGRFQELDGLFRRVALVSLAAMMGGGVAFWLFVACLQWGALGVADRLLNPTATAVFLLAVLLHVVSSCLVMYVRAHKREPFVILGVIESIAIGLGVWWFGRSIGPLGAGLALLAVRLLITLPVCTYIWRWCRREWHPTAANTL